MIKIVFQNTHWVFVDKPAGWLSVPSRLGQNDHRSCVGTILQDQLGKKIFPVHRLDQEVSGLILFALSAEAHRTSQVLFQNAWIEKAYHAVTDLKQKHSWKVGQKEVWTSKLLIGKRRVYESVSKDGRPVDQKRALDSKTVVEVLQIDTDSRRILWKVSPITGRRHQIRFEFFKHGIPIQGDPLYQTPQPDTSILKNSKTQKPTQILLRSVGYNLMKPGTEVLQLYDLPDSFFISGLSL